MLSEESKAMDVVNRLLEELPTRKLKSLNLQWEKIDGTSETVMPNLSCEFYEKEKE